MCSNEGGQKAGKDYLLSTSSSFQQRQEFFPVFTVVAFAMGSFSFRKEERIFRRAELIDLNIHGRRYYTKNFLVILKQNRRDITRLGITASKRVGNAVKRNRTKRLIREFFRLNKQQIPKGYDISIIALRVTDALNICKVQEELGDLLLRDDNPFS